MIYEIALNAFMHRRLVTREKIVVSLPRTDSPDEFHTRKGKDAQEVHARIYEPCERRR